ncbi:MAG TPA: type II toxin-antitoxin system RelE/ParE family toxin [Patescibacteria group bacterium]|nr:type II toxin-antitoxin system RelE/ParE family toxin [Patescibacteria group bacterium]
MAWQIEFDSEAENDLKKIDREMQRRILRYLRERIATGKDPRRFGAPLRRELSGLWKYRLGDYRIICRIEDKKVVVYVISVGHRKDIYKSK